MLRDIIPMCSAFSCLCLILFSICSAILFPISSAILFPICSAILFQCVPRLVLRFNFKVMSNIISDIFRDIISMCSAFSLEV